MPTTVLRYASGEEVDFELDSRFRVIEPLVKYNSAIAIVDDTVTHSKLVVKKLPRPVNRVQAARLLIELRLSRLMAHDNITPLLHSSISVGDENKFSALYMMYSQATMDLHRLIRSSMQLTGPHIVVITYQLLKALAHLHAHDVLHRDVKPSNVLLTSDFQVMLTDFGLSRALSEDDAAMSDYVCTRWYRAPELLMGAGRYSSAVDMWAVGCVMFECIAGRVLFPGKECLEQLKLITAMVGRIPEDEWAALGTEKTAQEYVRRLPGPARPSGWADLELPVPDDMMLLMRMLLQASPRERPTAIEAMQMDIFKDVYTPGDIPVVNTDFAAVTKKLCSFATIPSLEESIADIEHEVSNFGQGSSGAPNKSSMSRNCFSVYPPTGFRCC